MGEIRKVYTREFKVEAVRLLEESELSAQQIADDLGISTSSLHRWRQNWERTLNKPFQATAI